jgi:hypothetical protein
MLPTDIADNLDRFEWDTLRSFCAPALARAYANREAIQRLVSADLLKLQDDRPAITAKGRKVLVSGSPRLWNL